MSIVNELLPDDDSLVSDLPSYIRETRAALNLTGLMSTYSVEVTALDPNPELVGGLSVVNISAPSVRNVSTLTGGTAGDIVIFYAANSNITFIDAIGNISLTGDPAANDLPMTVGDMLVLVYLGVEWKEIHRTLL